MNLSLTKGFRKLFSLSKLFAKDLYYRNLSRHYKLLGSQYGGWIVPQKIKSSNLTLISCGVGEDISFDLDFLSHYNSRIIFVDPTPKAINHMNSIYSLTRNHPDHDCLPSTNNTILGQYKNIFEKLIASHESVSIVNEKTLMLDKAIGATHMDSRIIKLYMPVNKNFVSCSSLPEGKDTESSFEAQVISLNSIISTYSLESYILKLDVEGAEWDIIKDFDNLSLLPDFIMIEFHLQHLKKSIGLEKLTESIKILEDLGFKLVAKRRTDFCFSRQGVC